MIGYDVNVCQLWYLECLNIVVARDIVLNESVFGVELSSTTDVNKLDSFPSINEENQQRDNDLNNFK